MSQQPRGGYTQNLDLPYPSPEDAADVPYWVQLLAERLDVLLSGSGTGSDQVSAGTPVGGIILWGGPESIRPQNFLWCNGDWYPQDSWQTLYARIGNAWDGDTPNPGHFRVPNLQDVFVRGTSEANPTAGMRAGADSIGHHSHTMSHQHTHSHSHDIWHGHSVSVFGAADSGGANWMHGTHWVGRGADNYIIAGNEGAPGGPGSHVHGTGITSTGATGGPDNRTSSDASSVWTSGPYVSSADHNVPNTGLAGEHDNRPVFQPMRYLIRGY